MTDIAGTVPVIAVDKVQAVALAVCTYYFGVWLKGKVGVLSRYSIPSPVVGGMSFAIVVSFLEYFNIVKVQIDSTLQTVLMLGFFTTIGLMASLRVVKDGGRLLLGFLLAVTVLVFLQNGMGMAIAEAMGFDKHYGILAGSVSMMGGLGTAAAFGPYFEETYGITGGTAVADHVHGVGRRHQPPVRRGVRLRRHLRHGRRPSHRRPVRRMVHPPLPGEDSRRSPAA